jgi:hypothetical protein
MYHDTGSLQGDFEFSIRSLKNWHFSLAQSVSSDMPLQSLSLGPQSYTYYYLWNQIWDAWLQFSASTAYMLDFLEAPYARDMHTVTSSVLGRTLLRSTLGEKIHCDRRRPTRPRFDSRHTCNKYIGTNSYFIN